MECSALPGAVHLANGASMAAVQHGQPLDTIMGFTPTGGVMMGTRTGDPDPGLLIHLLTEKGYDAPQLDRLRLIRTLWWC